VAIVNVDAADRQSLPSKNWACGLPFVIESTQEPAFDKKVFTPEVLVG
jgi:hypothetical protein